MQILPPLSLPGDKIFHYFVKSIQFFEVNLSHLLEIVTFCPYKKLNLYNIRVVGKMRLSPTRKMKPSDSSFPDAQPQGQRRQPAAICPDQGTDQPVSPATVRNR